ncbi:LysR family transcriptional regulator [Massilia sp. KIM]|uniref:LysR family transcriptional regulator n=1 Tax=Massilia sp. KIM TaxID=1955422 RepID=UPI00098E96DE|nr:LysR family transcriptional regulator [Massilia sp. KIM]
MELPESASRARPVRSAAEPAALPELSQLVVLDCLLRERSLTRSAELLGMGQPTVSRVLARLRTHFNDPLFVRAGQRMQPTARALELAEPVAALLNAARRLQEGGAAFDPGSARRSFALFMVDGAIVHVLPRLLDALRHTAPGIQLRSVQGDPLALEGRLERGEIDLVIGRYTHLVNNIHRRLLWDDDHVVMMRRDHPRAGGLDRSTYLAQRHVLINMFQTSHHDVEVTRTLEELLPPENILCHVPGFTAASHIVLHTDAVVTMPRRLATALARDLGLVYVAVPVPIAPLQLSVYWHEHAHRDPANRWLREFARTTLLAPENA